MLADDNSDLGTLKPFKKSILKSMILREVVEEYKE